MGGGSDAPPPRPVLPPATPVAEENIGRTGYGEIPEGRTSMYGGDAKIVDTFPEDITPLELKNWYNHSLREDYPPIIANSEQNNRIWQEMEVERALDVHPTHEIHPNDLPNYHYWPSIQNEINPKIKNSSSDFINRFQMDETALPRFTKVGTPKTPKQEQDWYIPLKENGRFDYIKNNEINGYSGSIFDRKGWNRRYLLHLNIASIWGFDGYRGLTQDPIYFRHNELPVSQKFFRKIYGSTFDRFAIFTVFYVGALVYGSHSGSYYKELNWDNEAWNYDMEFSKYNRDKGGYHGLI